MEMSLLTALTPIKQHQGKQQQPHNLMSWLKHIKYHHDYHANAPSLSECAPSLPPGTTTTTTTTTTTVSPEDKSRKASQSSSTVSTITAGKPEKHAQFVLTSELLDSPKSDEEEQDSGNSSADDYSLKFKKGARNVSSMISRHFNKDSLMHSHKLWHDHHHSRTASTTSNASNRVEQQEDPLSGNTEMPALFSGDKQEESEESDGKSVQSKDWTKHPVCRCHSNVTSTDSVETLSIPENYDKPRNKSMDSLPEDFENPFASYKMVQENGELVDFDASSDYLNEDSDELVSSDYSNNSNLSGAILKIPRLRTVIRNDLIRLALNGPFQSPLDTQQKRHVLHIGCGDGSWSINTAQYFKNWLVVGLDDKTGGPIQDQRKVPKNFKYIRCYYDILKTIKELPSDSFDLVYGSFLSDTCGDEAYFELVKEVKRICKPGGYIELYELDLRIYGNSKAGPITHTLNAKVFQTMEKLDLNPRLARKLGDIVSEVFDSHNEQETQLEAAADPTADKKMKKSKYFETSYTSLPLGVWGGKLGVMFRDSITDIFQEYSRFEYDSVSDVPLSSNNNESLHGDDSISSHFDDKPNLDEMIETMGDELEDKKAFMNLHYVFARNTLPDSSSS